MHKLSSLTSGNFSRDTSDFAIQWSLANLTGNMLILGPLVLIEAFELVIQRFWQDYDPFSSFSWLTKSHLTDELLLVVVIALMISTFAGIGWMQSSNLENYFSVNKTGWTLATIAGKLGGLALALFLAYYVIPIVTGSWFALVPLI
ncbi:MAG: hypothetical protein AAFX40_09100, partial [Cyanobacteria bacterium J06639_1]